MPGFTGHSSVLLTLVQSVDRGFLGSLSCVAAKLGLAGLADSFYLCSAVIFKRCPGSFQASENEGFFAKCRVEHSSDRVWVGVLPTCGSGFWIPQRAIAALR